MATFSYTSYAIYDRDGGSSNFSDVTFHDTSGTLNDTELDGSFESGDPISGGAVAGTYYGTFTDAGSNVYVVIQNAPNEWYIYSVFDAATTDANLPKTIHETNDINQATFLTCFLGGSLISTDHGERPVECLSTGDLVLTAEGHLVPVKWVGRQTVSTRFGPAERLMPVRIAAGALGNGLPHTELTVTADHGMLVDGVICHAGALVNGETITKVPLADMGETYTVYHIETEAHEIILANGAPAETFIDNVSRRAFDNFDEFDALYGDVPEMAELPYPRAMSARQVPAQIRRSLAAERRGKTA